MEPQLPAVSSVAPLVRWNRHLERSPVPRLVLGTALAVYGGFAASYALMLIVVSVPALASMTTLGLQWIALHLLFAAVPLVVGSALAAAGVARWRGHHGHAHSLESLGWKAVASAVAIVVASALVL
jgi:hypothetical protein